MGLTPTSPNLASLPGQSGKLYELNGDKAFLDEVYDTLVRSHHWWFAEQDADHDGLCEYTHPYSSGLDNSPLFDRGAPLESPDLTAYMILQDDHLAKIAHELGRRDEAREWSQAAEGLAQRLLDLRWDEAAGYFWTRCKGEIVPVRTHARASHRPAPKPRVSSVGAGTN